MDYEKKYKQALDWAKSAIEAGANGMLKEDLEYIFPELAGSEDERIRKAIKYGLDYVFTNNTTVYETTKERCLAWLEKQGEQKPADMVEPKFHEGEWVVRELDNTCYQIKKCILNVTNNKYGYDLTSGGYISSQDANFYHLWTIQDAKDGDVLAAEDKDKVFIYNGKLDLKGRVCAYCGIYKTYDELRFTECAVGNSFTYKEPSPATKEQRNLLFQKMKEAGYEWDVEKKELKKIEQKTILDVEIPFGAKDSDLEEVSYNIPIGYHAEIEDNKVVIKKGEQKSAEWSEQDEYNKRQVCRILREAGCSQKLQDKINSWLESFRFQPHWKPSDEHYELEEFAKIVRGNLTGISKAVQKLFEAKYLQLTGNKMYGGFKD